MRDALARDLREICGAGLIEAVSPSRMGLQAGQRMVERDPPWAEWGALLAASERALLVAPECGGELLALTLQAELHGARQLGCSTASIFIAGSKARTAAWLSRAGLPVVPTFPLHGPAARNCAHRDADTRATASSWVVKPDDGAGATGVRRIAIPGATAPGRLEQPRVDGPRVEQPRVDGPQLEPPWVDGPRVVQPWVDGPSGSLFVFSNAQGLRLLASSTQHVEWPDHQARLVGLGVNESLLPWDTAQALAARVATALPGLSGLWGVDFVLAVDGPRLLEVNPRPTSTYPALRDSLGWNPARLLLGLAVPPDRGGPGSPIRLGFE